MLHSPPKKTPRLLTYLEAALTIIAVSQSNCSFFKCYDMSMQNMSWMDRMLLVPAIKHIPRASQTVCTMQILATTNSTNTRTTGTTNAGDLRYNTPHPGMLHMQEYSYHNNFSTKCLSRILLWFFLRHTSSVVITSDTEKKKASKKELQK